MKPVKNSKKDINSKPKARLSPISDFLMNASPEEKQRVYKEVIRRSNEDQRKVMREAGYTFDSSGKLVLPKVTTV